MAFKCLLFKPWKRLRGEHALSLCHQHCSFQHCETVALLSKTGFVPFSFSLFFLSSNLHRSSVGPPVPDFYVLELLFCLCPSYRGCLLAAWQPRVSKVAAAEQTVGTAG